MCWILCCEDKNNSLRINKVSVHPTDHFNALLTVVEKSKLSKRKNTSTKSLHFSFLLLCSTNNVFPPKYRVTFATFTNHVTSIIGKNQVTLNHVQTSNYCLTRLHCACLEGKYDQQCTSFIVADLCDNGI